MLKLKNLLLELMPYTIFANTSAKIINRVKDHTIKSNLLTITKAGKFVYQTVTINPPKDKDKPHIYRQYIWPREAMQKLDKSEKEKVLNTTFFSTRDDVYLQCTCPYFRYHLEVALNYHKASDIKIMSNGQEPVIRNPKKHPHACKHLIASLITYKKNVENYNKRKERRLTKLQQQKQREADDKNKEQNMQ